MLPGSAAPASSPPIESPVVPLPQPRSAARFSPRAVDLLSRRPRSLPDLVPAPLAHLAAGREEEEE